MVCEDTCLVSTSTRNAGGAFLIGRSWNGCNASTWVVLLPDTGNFTSIYGIGDVLGAGDKVMAQPERFTLRNGESTKKPWIVETLTPTLVKTRFCTTFQPRPKP